MQWACDKSIDDYVMDLVKDETFRDQLAREYLTRHSARQMYMSNQLGAPEVQWELKHLFLTYLLMEPFKDIFNTVYRELEGKITQEDVHMISKLLEHSMIQGLISLRERPVVEKHPSVEGKSVQDWCRHISMDKPKWSRDWKKMLHLQPISRAPAPLSPSALFETPKKKKQRRDVHSPEESSNVYNVPFPTPLHIRQKRLATMQARKMTSRKRKEVET